MNDVERVLVNTYDGSMESLELMVDLLDLESHEYHFDIKTKRMYIQKIGLILKPGDCYHTKMNPEKFEAIG